MPASCCMLSKMVGAREGDPAYEEKFAFPPGA